MQIKFALLVVFQVVVLNEAYNFSCPPQAHWELRAKSLCIPPRNYTCLYNVTFRVNVYRDRCSRPRILAPGYKYVFQPNLNRAACSFTRYQPFIFDTIGRSDCTFLKSFCNSEGQMTFKNATTKSDRTCICNINEGYTFVTETNNQCSCNPSNEDCSCYIDTNHNNRTIGSKDSKCYGEITRTPSPSRGDTFNKSQIVKIKAFDNYKYNLVLPKEKYSTTAAIYVLILVLAYHLVTVALYILQRILRHLISTPKCFGIEGCTDRSITVKWNIDNLDERLHYEIDYRRKGSANWMTFILSTTDVLTDEKGFCVYELHHLLPKTDYELRVCSVNNEVKGHYTESKTHQTLKTAPQNFDIVECTDRSIFVKWKIDYKDDCRDCALDHRPKGSAEWISLSISTTESSTEEKEFRVFELQDLLPERSYELRMCYIENNFKGQYTEMKTQQTLKTVLPEAINRLPEGDRVRYNNLLQNSNTGKRYFVRIMIIGEKSAGKTCLVTRLLKDNVDEVSSTNGIDIVVRRCKINIKNDKWIIDKDINNDKTDRMKGAVLPTERTKIGNTESNLSIERYINKINVSEDKSTDDLYDSKLDVTSGVSVENKETLEENAYDCKLLQPCVYL